MEGKDPAKVIREALGQVLVFYYPFAGRLREAPNGKLMVDCNAEGVLFIEADADVTLEDFGDATCLPFPCFEELLYDVPGSNGLLNCPSLLIQFMHAMAEIARGALTPSIQPVWERHLLSVRDPPFITCVHHAYNDALFVDAIGTVFSTNNLVCRSFFFRATHISAFRRFILDNVRCWTFDILTACIWRCRMKATEEHMRSMIDMLVIKDRPVLCYRLWLVLDLR
ncbi:hypothetical protein V6N13_137569 [Hibiscus sabdariffa]